MIIRSLLISFIFTNMIYGKNIKIEEPIATTNVQGQGFLKTRGGDIKTCAGENVVLLNSNDYPKYIALMNNFREVKEYQSVYDYYEACKNLYCNNNAADKLIETLKNMKEKYNFLGVTGAFDPDVFKLEIKKINNYYVDLMKKNVSIIKTTVCDAAGNFEFRKIPYGNYAAITTVSWDRPSTFGQSILTVSEGGMVSQIFKVDEDMDKVFISQTVSKE